MADSNYSPSVTQGFNFEKDAQVCVGFINSLKIGDTELAVDLAVTDPENISGDKIKVVGVMNSAYWEGGYNAPFQLGAQVSNENKKSVATLTHTSMSNTAVEINYTIYEYDPAEKCYYKAFHCNDTAMMGLIEKRGGQLALAIDDQAGYEIVSPLNFALSIGVNPQEQAQEMHLAVSVSDKFVKAWGTAVAA